MKRTTRRRAVLSAVSCVALLGVATGTALASPANHSAIVLKDAGGAAISKNADGSAAAFSMKSTCFTGGCHGDAAAGGTAVYSYDDIERHNYHAQIGANEIRGFNAFNIDSPDKWRTGAGPQAKNWVQSPGHVGSW